MTKLFSGAPINYGPLLPPATALSNGALFFKTKVDPDGVSNPSGLYIFSFKGDVTPSALGDQVGFAWVPSVVLTPYLLRDGSMPMTGNLISSAGIRVSYGLPSGTDLTNFGYAFGNDGDTGMFATGIDPAAQKLSFFLNSTERLTITTSDVQIAGFTVWHAGNDGAGSTLDADTLDNQHASAFVTRATLNDPVTDPWSIPLNTRTSGVLGIGSGGTNMTTVNQNGLVYATSVTSLGTTAAGSAGQMLITNASGLPTWANVTSVVSSNASSVTNAGIGPMTFAWEGQSGQPTWLWGSLDGSISKVWNPSNFNVSNATTVSGYLPNAGAVASTVAIRDSNGDIFARYLNTTATENENPAFGQFMVSVNGDPYVRRASVAHVTSALGLNNYVSKTGDTMTGELNMSTHKITSLAAPTVSADAANMGYVDATVDLARKSVNFDGVMDAAGVISNIGLAGWALGKAGKAVFHDVYLNGTGTFDGDITGSTGRFDGTLAPGVVDLTSMSGVSYTYSSPGTYSVFTLPWTGKVRFSLVGGGGGGAGGGTDLVGNSGLPGGVLVNFVLTNVPAGTTISLTVGAGGYGAGANTSNAAAPGNGGNGGSSYVTIGANTYSVLGGAGGTPLANTGSVVRNSDYLIYHCNDYGDGAGATTSAGSPASYTGSTGGSRGGATLPRDVVQRGANYYQLNGGNGIRGGAGGGGAPSRVWVGNRGFELDPVDGDGGDGLPTTLGGNGGGGYAIIEIFNPDAPVLQSAFDTYVNTRSFDSGWINTLPAANTATFVYTNMNAIPKSATMLAECLVAELGYSPGDVVTPMSVNMTWAAPVCFMFALNAVYLLAQNNPNPWWVTPRTGGSATGMTASNWRYKVIVSY